MVTRYPSIPIPTADTTSIHQAMLAMRQTISLLIVNQQLPSESTLTKASQIFATNDNVSRVLQNISQIVGPPGPPGTPGKGATPSSSLPLMDGVATIGVSTGYSRGDHVHPRDTAVPVYTSLPINAANDAAAATAGVPVGGVYRNGSVLMVRVA